MPLTKFPGYIVALAALTLPLVLVAPALADGPAVSGINGKVEGFGGIVNTDFDQGNEGSGGGAASLSVPLGNFIGFQIDGLAGEFADQGVAAVGAHLFWRDPEVA